MRFSLLVVTTDRIAKAEQLFLSLTTQTYNDFDVVFVHNECCATEADALCERFKDRLRIKKITTAQRSASKSRNLGLPHLSGDYIAFPDDDCRYPASTLATVEKIFASSPLVDGILAVSRNSDAGHPESEDFMCPRKESKYSVCRHSETYLQFYRKSCVDAVGGFDEKLGPGTGLPHGCGEDTDYVLRVLHCGFTVVRSLVVSVLHPAAALDSPTLHAKAAMYAGGRMYLLRKHHFSLWFRYANVLYPLACIPVEIFTKGWRSVFYRLVMFQARLKHF